jgi:DeoR family deoxyribose operon repressor
VYNPEPPFNETERGYFLTEESRIYREEKSRIGKRAASLIKEDDTIIIDAGSTTEWLAKHLPEALPVTVLCYSLNILIEVRYKNPDTLVFGGGNFHENTLVFSSPEGLELIRRFRANKAFISAGGVNAKLGVTCLNPYEIEIKRAVLESSLQRVLLVDSSKFDMVKSCYFAELTDFHTIITDSNISETYRENIADAGIELIIV